MYLHENHEGPYARVLALKQPPAGPGFTEAEVEGVTRIEVWATQITDPGPDHCLFKIFKDGAQVGEKRVEGY